MKKVVLLILFFFLCTSQAWSAPVVNRIVALVNGETITLFELESRLRHLIGMFEDVDISQIPESQLEQTRRQVLNQMINDILFKQEAGRFGIEASDRDIDNHIRQVREDNNMSEEQFLAYLEGQGLNMDSYRSQIRDNIIRQRVLSMMVRRKVVVTRDEVEAYYNEHSSRYQEDKQVHLKVILVPDLAKANEIRLDILSGDLSFDQAAQEFSQGPNAGGGGDLGMVGWDRIAPEWRQALDNLQKGDVSRAFEVRGAGALLKLQEIRSGGTVPLSEVEEEIREVLYDAKLERRFEEYIQGLRERAVIDVRL